MNRRGTYLVSASQPASRVRDAIVTGGGARDMTCHRDRIAGMWIRHATEMT